MQLENIASLSRRRSLLRDVTEGMKQQMYFWGCDAGHVGGNLLVKLGMERCVRASAHGEGSSRYVEMWEGGVVELHSFCAGWYPRKREETGVVFIRSRERIFGCTAGGALTPGQYAEERLLALGADELLECMPPLLRWVLAHEVRLIGALGEDYREGCWKEWQERVAQRDWLRPNQGRAWYRHFLEHRNEAVRPRRFAASNL